MTNTMHCGADNEIFFAVNLTSITKLFKVKRLFLRFASLLGLEEDMDGEKNIKLFDFFYSKYCKTFEFCGYIISRFADGR